MVVNPVITDIIGFFRTLNDAHNKLRWVMYVKKGLQTIAINLAMFCTLLVLIEFTGQLLFYFKSGYFISEGSEAILKNHQKLFEIHPYLAARLKNNITLHFKNKTITTTGEHTRWTGAPKNEDNLTRIVTIGGSTTFGSGVTDVDSWPAILQKILGDKYSVTNYGGPGYSTAEAIVQTSLVVPEKKPHFIIHFHGWNDLKNYHKKELGADYYGHGYSQYSHLGIPLYKEKTPFEKLREVSSIAWLADNINSKLANNPTAKEEKTYTSNDPFVDKIYQRNLESLLLLSKRTGAKVIFIPQVLNYTAYKENEAPDKWTKNIENQSMPILIDKFNLIMAGICSEKEADCKFLNNVLSLDWENSDFIDYGHFSRKGGQKFASILSKEIKN